MKKSQEQEQSDRQAAAVLTSCAIVIGFILYWAVQIQDVREMLALAYG